MDLLDILNGLNVYSFCDVNNPNSLKSFKAQTQGQKKVQEVHLTNVLIGQPIKL